MLAAAMQKEQPEGKVPEGYTTRASRRKKGRGKMTEVGPANVYNAQDEEKKKQASHVEQLLLKA